MRLHHFFAGLLLGVMCAGCGDGTGPSEIPEELVGSWLAAPGCLSAGCAFSFIPVENPADSLNIVAFAGISMEVTVTRAGSFTMVARPGSIPPVSGRAEAKDGVMVLREGTATDTLDYTVTAERLTLHFRGEFTVYDFDGDEVEDPARVRGTFVRQ